VQQFLERSIAESVEKRRKSNAITNARKRAREFAAAKTGPTGL
jgi:hypothetical protein